MLYPQRTAMGLSLLAAIAVSAPARAQILTLNNNQEGVNRGPSHDSKLLAVNEINKADCLNDEIIQFNIGITGVIDQEYSFQVWKGTDCANGKTRFEDTSNCIQIPGDWAREERSINVAIPVRTLVTLKKGGSTNSSGGTGGTAGAGGTGGTDASSGGSSAAGSGGAGAGGGGSGGTEAASGSGGSGGGGSGADGTSGSGAEGGAPTYGDDVCGADRTYQTPQDLFLHFIVADSNGEQPASDYMAASWPAKYDLVGPNAPRGVKAGVGESTLILSWTIEDNRGDIDHFNAYCNAAPDMPQRCTQDLPVNMEPPADKFCGESEGYSASMQTENLENNVTYEVAVAGVDNFYNVGLLSESTCEAPQLVTDFYEAYREAGGQGGGGFCAIGAGRSRGFAAFLALGALALYARRRSARLARKTH
jgi:hypothetical protein